MDTSKFTKRVYGAAIVKAVNANYNADFTKMPRTLPSGIVYATDKALKYTNRYFWYKNYPEDKILYFTRYKNVENGQGQYIPMSLRELYENLFGAMERNSKKHTGNKMMLFYYDGEKAEGKLPSLKPSALSKYYKELDEKPAYAAEFSRMATEALECKIEEVESSVFDEPGYFYVSKNGEAVMLNLEDSVMESAIEDLDIYFFGKYDKIKVLYNLLNCLDVRLFGVTFAGNANVSIHGPVQVCSGVDRFFYEGGVQNLSYTEQIKSPVRNDKSNNKEAEMTTIGSASKTMEAHYVHNFSINPKNLDDSLNIVKNLEGVQPIPGIFQSDIEKLKESLRCGATFYDSTSKAGLENEVLIWVELKEGSKQVIPNFTELISVSREKKVVVDLSNVAELLNRKHMKEQIDKVCVYYNSLYTELKGIDNSGFSLEELELFESNTGK